MKIGQSKNLIFKAGLMLFAGLFAHTVAIGQMILPESAEPQHKPDFELDSTPLFAMAKCVPGTVNRFTGSYHSNLYIGNDNGVNVLLAWGQNMKTYTTGVTGDYTTAFFVSTSSYSGIPYEVRSSSTGGGAGPSVMAMRTSTKLYVFGNINNISGITSMAGFGALALTNPNADVTSKLPAGVGIADIAEFAVSPTAIGIVTTSGNVYMLTQMQTLQGDNAVAGPAIWHQVKLFNGTALAGVVKFSLSASGAFALTASGKMYYWGKPANVNGSINLTTSYNYAYDMSAQIPTGTGVLELVVLGKDTGPNDLFLLCDNLKVYSCGLNDKGVLGVGNASTTYNQASFQQVSGLSNIVHIDGNTEASLFTMGAMTSTGKIYGWGDGVACMLGIAAQSSFTTNYVNAAPVDIFGVDGFTDFSISGHFTIAFYTNPLTAVDQYCYVGHNAGGSIGLPAITTAVISKTAIARLDAPLPISFICSNTQPTIGITESLKAFSSCIGSSSANQTIVVSGNNLIKNLIINAPAGFGISTSVDTGYGSTVTLTQSSGTIVPTNIYIRIIAGSIGTFSGNLVVSSKGAITQNLAISGTVNSLPLIDTVIGATRTGSGTVTVSGTVNPAIGSTIDWFKGSSAGSPLKVGSLNYLTGILDSTTTFFAEARNTNTGCVSIVRIPVIAIINKSFEAGSIGGNQTVCLGDSITGLSSITDASGGTGVINYQWQVSTISNSAGFTDIPFANLSTYAPSALTQTSYFRRVANTIADGNIYSNVVAIFMNPLPKAATAINGSRTGPGIVTIGALVAAGETVDWYAFSSGGTILSGGTGTSSFNTPSIASTTNYFALARNTNTGCVSPTRTQVVANIVIPTPVITVAGTLNAFTACIGSISSEQSFTVTASNLVANLEIFSASGFEISTVSGSGFSKNLSLLPVSGSIATTTIYVRLSNDALNEASGNIMVSSTNATTANIATGIAKISALSNAGIISGSKTVCAGNNSSNLSLVGNLGTILKWQSALDPGFSFPTDISNLSTNLTVSNIDTSTYYRVIVQNEFCSQVVSAPVLVTVNKIPVFTPGIIEGIKTTARSFSIPFTASNANQFSIALGARALTSFNTLFNQPLYGTNLNIPIPTSVPGSYDFNIRVSDSTTGCESALVPVVLNIEKQNPVISLQDITKNYRDPSFTIAAVSNSTGAISYTSSNLAVATISGNQVSILGIGTSIITVTQAESLHYLSGTVTATLTVRENAPYGLSYSGPNIYSVLNPIAALTPSVSGNVTSYSISPELPAGLNINSSTGVISGTASQAREALVYTVTASNMAGSISTMVIIAVNKLLPTISMNDIKKTYGAPNFLIDAISNSPGKINYSISNVSIATIIGNMVTLKSGGIATITASQEATDQFESAIVKAQLLVNDLPKIGLEYPQLNILTIDKIIQPIKPIEKGVFTEFSISPSLPTGLSIDSKTGNITGKPNALSRLTVYSVFATNGFVSFQTTLNIQVNDMPPVFVYQPETDDANPRLPIKIAIPKSTGGKVVNYSISPALPVGIELDSKTGVITGKIISVKNGLQEYLVTGANSGGVTNAKYTLVFNSAPSDIVLNNHQVLENLPNSTQVGLLNTTDKDDGDTHSYELVSGIGSNDNALFEIRNNVLVCKTSFNFEQKSDYQIRIQTTDEGGLVYEKSFHILIIDVNEVPTLAPIGDIRVYNLSTEQEIGLLNLSTGNDLNQSLEVQLSSSKINLFKTLKVVGSRILFTLKPDVFGNDVLIKVLVKDNGGVSNGGVDTLVRTFILGIDPLPKVTATPTQITPGKTSQLQVEAAHAIEYRWNNINAIVGSTGISNPVIRPIPNDIFIVTVKNKWGYTAEGSVKVIVDIDYSLEPKNILTPNADGHNDKWMIANIECYPNSEVAVYDKSGKLVYKEKGYKNQWDGKMNGVALKDDTYFYIIQFNKPNVKPIKGYLTIIH